MRAYQGYDHSIRRGAWQALTWTFLLDVALVNSYLLQLHGQPSWKRYTSQKEWRRCIHNELFKAFHTASQSRRKFRTGDEFTPIAQHEFIARGKKSDCVACQGYRLGQPRSRSSRRPLAPVSNNRRGQRRRQSTKGCTIRHHPFANPTLSPGKKKIPPPKLNTFIYTQLRQKKNHLQAVACVKYRIDCNLWFRSHAVEWGT